MYILIAGAGAVGSALAQKLHRARHDVVCIDPIKDVAEALYARHGVQTVQGSATEVDILEEAGVRKADVAVGTMRVDADNLAFSLLANDFGVPRVIVRMRDPRYERAYKLAGVTRTLNIVDVLISHLALEIEEPDMKVVAAIGGGRASVAMLRVPQQWKARSLVEIGQGGEFPTQAVISGIYREEEDRFVVPRGECEVRPGDQIFVAADLNDMRDAAIYFGLKPPRNVRTKS